MTNIELFNEKYGLTNISTNAFNKIATPDQSNDLAGKTKKNYAEVIKRFLSNKVALIALIVFIIIIVTSIVAPLVSDYSPNDSITKVGSLNSITRNLPSHNSYVTTVADGDFLKKLNANNISYTKIESGLISSTTLGQTVIHYKPWDLVDALEKFKHHSIIGTNSESVDIWTRTWFGTAQSLKLALLVAVISVIIGTVFGSFLGLYVGSWADIIVMQFLGCYSSIPTVVWNVLILMILPRGYWAEVTLFSLTGWISSFALSRSYMWRYVNSDFMKVAKTLGVSQFGRIFKHALPNYIGIIAYSLVLSIPSIIESEATLGFLGLSPNPTGASLGNVLNEMGQAISGATKNVGYVLLPVSIIMVLTIALKFMAIGVNDAFEPKYVKR